MAATLRLRTEFDNERYSVIYCATFAGVQKGGTDSHRISGGITHNTQRVSIIHRERRATSTHARIT